MEQLKKVQNKYPGIELKKVNNQWQVIIPDKYKEGHEAHFAKEGGPKITMEVFTKRNNANMGGSQHAG